MVFPYDDLPGSDLVGAGIYFAEKAAYSSEDKYVFQGQVAGMPAGEGYRELLLAKVLVGEVADLGRPRPEHNQLKCPPTRDDGPLLRCAGHLAIG
jgi:hypothetical protein